MMMTRYVQYSIRLGSGSSSVGSCLRPDSHNELVLLQTTCNGGVDWQTLQQIHPDDKHTQPMYVQQSWKIVPEKSYVLTIRRKTSNNLKSPILGF